MSSNDEEFDESLSMFYVEARDLIQEIEDNLLGLEGGGDATETIGALFRAAHTIKGTAGMFGMDRIVKFTHQIESVMDRVRNGHIKIDIDLSTTLLKSTDILSALFDQAEQHQNDPAFLAKLDADTQVIYDKLSSYLPATKKKNVDKKKVETTSEQSSLTSTSEITALPTSPPPGDVLEPEEPEAPEAETGITDTWYLLLRFGDNTYRHGCDPLSIIQYLQNLGEILTCRVIDDRVPMLGQLDPTLCQLGFELALRSTCDEAKLNTAFEFVRDDCEVHMILPKRSVNDFVAQLNDLPTDSRLGDLLVACGAVSLETMQKALAYQATLASDHSSAVITEITPLGTILIEQKKVSPEVVEAVLEKQGKLREEARFVRVPADKLDHLINLVGELVICGASASLRAVNLHDQPMIETTQQISGLVEEIRNGTLSLRMVQIGDTFSRYRRVVHDTASAIGKEIRLEIEGSETELDKSVVEKIGDPLMHLVRNSMDHGIEPPDVREALGKPRAGTLLLSARHDSGNIVIRVSDDGKGIDGDVLLAKAREKGLVGANQILSETDKLNLIFAAGFSTAEKITNLSGRGVGMDVVKQNIQALRGSVDVKSVVGMGTTIEIRLPLTLAIIDGFLVKVGKGFFVIPLLSVVECIDANPEQVKSSGNWAGNLNLRGKVLSYLELRQVFEVGEDVPDRRSIVVVKNGDSYAGLVVDQLVGEYQTVIKPLGKLFKHLRGISGSTVLGSGEVALILDVPALVKLATERENLNGSVLMDVSDSAPTPVAH